MISRIVNTAIGLLVYLFAATLVAEMIVLGYVWSAWNMDKDRLMRTLAAAQGVEPADPLADAVIGEEQIATEEPSYEEIVERRAIESRDLELREQALQNAVKRLKSEQQQLAEDRTKYQNVVGELDARLAALAAGATTEGRVEARRILESLKPEQAKEQLMIMLQNDELDEVVILLSDMQDLKRAKILAEFKLVEETKQVAEVLRRIREGDPQGGVVREAQRKLGSTLPNG